MGVWEYKGPWSKSAKQIYAENAGHIDKIVLAQCKSQLKINRERKEKRRRMREWFGF